MKKIYYKPVAKQDKDFAWIDIVLGLIVIALIGAFIWLN